MTLKKRLRSRSVGSIPVALVAGSLVAAGVGFAVEGIAESPYMDVSDVKPGMKGYGMTVFSGTKPEKFDIEVISTLHNFQPGQDLVLVKTLHPRLQIARTVAGMSGSPIYINGKLIGAYAYGWMFNVEPVAGVTPIANMLSDLKRPVPRELLPGFPRRPLPTTKKTARAGIQPTR
ncbi:MAG: SpoIVB peptidase S55 domain-containing protein, partial [Myxococcota bacterium]